MANIFISYRRLDSASVAERIYETLVRDLGATSVFMDVSGIEPGDHFERTIRDEIETSQVVLAVVGRTWAFVTDAEGGLRLDNPHDLVRREIMTAAARGIRIVPLVIGGATIPEVTDLPPALAFFAKLNAFPVSEEDFEDDLKRIVQYIRMWGGKERTFSDGGNLKAKVCLVGAAGVGKTSLVRSLVRSPFKESYLTTLGVYISKTEIRVGDSVITVILNDLEGEEPGHSVPLRHVRGSSGLVIVADGRKSALEAAMLLKERFRNDLSPIPMVLAANKIDLYSEWEYPIEALESTGVTTFTTSAKTGKAVEAMFQHLGRKILGL